MTSLPKAPINPLITLRELFPLLIVIFSLFGLLVYSITAVESPKSKPIVRNEGVVFKLNR